MRQTPRSVGRRCSSISPATPAILRSCHRRSARHEAVRWRRWGLELHLRPSAARASACPTVSACMRSLFGDISAACRRSWSAIIFKAAVTTPIAYDPGSPRTYAEMAGQYGHRASGPRRGAKVQCPLSRRPYPQRWILARLRNRVSFPWSELNARHWSAVPRTQRPPDARFPGSSRGRTIRRDRSSQVGELPDQPYVFARWKRCRVAPDYHVEIDCHCIHPLPPESVKARRCPPSPSESRAGLPKGAEESPATPVRPSAWPHHYRRSYAERAPPPPPSGQWTPGAISDWREDRPSTPAAFFQGRHRGPPTPINAFAPARYPVAARSYDNARVERPPRGILIKARSPASIRSISKRPRSLLSSTIRSDSPPFRHGKPSAVRAIPLNVRETQCCTSYPRNG